MTSNDFTHTRPRPEIEEGALRLSSHQYNPESDQLNFDENISDSTLDDLNFHPESEGLNLQEDDLDFDSSEEEDDYDEDDDDEYDDDECDDLNFGSSEVEDDYYVDEDEDEDEDLLSELANDLDYEDEQDSQPSLDFLDENQYLDDLSLSGDLNQNDQKILDLAKSIDIQTSSLLLIMAARKLNKLDSFSLSLEDNQIKSLIVDFT